MKKIALITGASGDIGRAICNELAKKNYNLIMHYSSNKNSCYELKMQLEKQYDIEASIIQANFEDVEQVQELAKLAIAKYGKIDVLVNNAGVSLVELFQDVSLDMARKIMSVNLTNTMLLTQSVLPRMIREKSGVVVNISSMWGICGASMEVHYSASKAGLIGMSKALAKEVGISGIRVNCVCPGYIDTKMNSGFSSEDVQMVVCDTPLNRVGKVEDVAQLVGFLSGDESSFITGQVISVDGGYSIT